jgi:2,4-diketo-3-deoxy-L-fuconate hydrolase
MSNDKKGTEVGRRSLLTGAAAGLGAAALMTAATSGSGTAHAQGAAPGMRLLRFGEPGREKPGVELADGTRLDVSEWIPDFNPAFFANDGVARLKQVATPAQCPKIPASMRLGPPVANPKQFLAIGLNYRRHIAEVGAQLPKEPEVFIKLNNCICGPTDDLLRPKGSVKLDYEAELAYVIKDKVRYLASPEVALKHVAGYLICNDVSERDWQRLGTQWTKGKGSRHFGPLGPYLTLAEDVGDPQTLDIQTKVNGQVRQKSNTSDMVFGVAHLTWYLSQFFTLEAGDIVTTGTPEGVAMGMKPPGWIVPGDVVEITLSKLGTQRTVVRDVTI